MAQSAGAWEGKPVRAFLIRAAVTVLPIVFAVIVAWQLTRILPTPSTWPGVIFWWLLVMVTSTLALRIADGFAKKLMPLAVLMKLSLVFPDKAPNRFGVSFKTGNAHSLEELLERAERAGKQDDLTHAAETILALAAALNAHDPRTRGHGDRVRAYADMLGEEMGYSEEERNKLKWAAMLHDIGKLRVPAEIINSPGKLTDEEWKVMRNHPDWGMELAAPLLPWLGEFAAAIGQHHERFDGNGYPNGLAGEDIGLAARVTSVADTYDVMTSVRSYKEARPASEAREELARCAGSQFDPVVVRAFLNISLGRQRWVAGPLSWLAQVPFFQSALQGATTLAQNAAVAAQTGLTATAIGATAMVAPAIIDTPDLTPRNEVALPAIVVVANDDSMTLPEDATETVFVLGNDDLDVLSLSIVSGPSHGTATLSLDGTLTYTPNPNFTGTDTIVYRACGPGGRCDTAVLSIEVTGVNDPPGLLPVPARLNEDSSTVIDVISKVTDIDGDPASAEVSLVGIAAEGLVLANGDGTFTYTPPPNFYGTDSFTVQICDAGGACELRTLSVTVTPVNDAPTVTIIPPAAIEDTPVSIFVDAFDPDGDALTTRVVAGPTSGTAVVDVDGSIYYTPGSNFNGSESITIEVCDAATCSTEVIAFAVAAVNDPPIVPGPGPLTTLEETMVSFDPLAGAIDPEGGVLSLAGFDAVSVAGGSVVEGSLEYTPTVDFVGGDTFTYTVADPQGATTTVTVTVNVSPVNDDPVALPDAYSIAEDGILSIGVPGVLANDSDVDGDPLSASLQTAPASGTVLLDSDGSFTYSPDPDFTGPDSFEYRVDDGAGGFAIGTVAIEVAPVNDAPIAADDLESTLGPGPVSVAVLDNDIDVEGDFDPASVTVVVPPVKGLAAAQPDGTVDYTPTEGETGSDSFVYQVCDTEPLCDTATVTMGLMGPEAVDDAASMAEDAGPITIDAVANDSDPDGNFDPASAAVFAAAGNGTATANGDGTFDYDPDPDFNGVDSFDYRVCDLAGACDAATVTITVSAVNDVPVAGDDGGVGFTTVEDTPFTTGNVTANDTDVEDGVPDPTTVVIVGPTPPGLTNNGDGTVDYNPPLNSNGDVVFTYEVDDSAGATSNTATVTITVSAVNDVPVAGDDGGVGFTTVEDTPFTTGNVTANDTDVEDGVPDPTTVVIVGPTPPGLTNNGDGTFDYNPPLNSNGDVVFTYEVDDSAGATSNTATVTITVSADNDAPVAGDDTPSVAEDTATGVTFDVLSNDTDVDLDTLSIDSFDASSITVGTLTDNGGGNFTYVAPAQYFGTQSFTYDVTDGALTDTGSVTITVTNVPDAPDTQDDAYSTNRDTVLASSAPGVLANDTDYDGDALTAALASPPTNGGVVLNGDGSFTYTPDPGFVGSDSFSYSADDGLNPPVPATVDITVDDGIVEAGWFFGDSGTAPETYAFVSSPPPPGNPDPDGDGNPGLTILKSGGGEGESDPLKYQQWLLTPSASPVELNGPVTLKLWSTVEFFTLDQDIDLTVWIHDCDSTGTVCGPALLSYDVHYDNWNGGVADFVYREVTVGSLDHTVAIGRSLRFRLQFDHEPVWVGMSADYPTEVVFTEANRPPVTVSDGASLLEDAGPVNIDVLANDTDPNLDPASLAIVGAPANGTAAVVAGPSIDYDPDPDYFGADSFTYEICDTSASCSTETVSVTVTSVNDVPSFTVGADETILEDAGARMVDPHATAISPGPANESGQAVSFTVTNDNPALFKNAPAINPAGRLQYEAWGDMSGSATVTVSLSDDGGTANGGVDTSADQTFTITVTGVNDQPGFNDGANQTVDEDSGPHTVVGWATAITAGAPEEEPPAQTLTFNVVANTNPGLFSAGPAVDPATGNLTYTLTPDANGAASIDLTLSDDGGTANGGIDTSATRTFTITVGPVNDEPSFTSGGNVTVLEDSGNYSAVWATAISMGAANEAGQTGTFAITGNTNPGLFATGPAVAADGTLTFAPAGDTSGAATISIELRDNGGTANGGDDTSPSVDFTITVDPVNDKPDFATGADVTVNEDTGPHTIAGWATSITAGAADEEPPAQTLTFNVTSNDNGPLFTAGPTIDPASGDLSFTLASNASGSANIQVRLEDDGGTANGGDDTSATRPFRITVDSVNDPPSFTKGADQTVIVDSGAHSIAGWATGISPGAANESGQSVSFNTTGNTNPALFSVPPLVSSTGTLTFTVANGQTGTATVTIEAQDDGGTANGGDDTSAGQSFAITVVDPLIVVSEFRPDGPLGANDEFVEVFNAGSAAVDVTGWKLHVTSGVDIDFYTFPGVTLNPGQHYLVAHPSVAAGLGADGVTSGVIFGPAWGDVQILTSAGTQVDAFHYGTGPTVGEGSPLPVWVTTGIDGSFERRDGLTFGNCVDTDDNLADFVRRHGTSTPQSSAAPFTLCSVPATAGHLVISEFRSTGPAGFEDEFVEIFNPTAAPVDVSNWQLVVPGTGVLHTYQTGTVVAPGGRYVVAPGSGYPGFKDDTYNGVLAFPYLVQFGGHIELRTDTAALVDAVAWGGFAAEGSPLADYSAFSTLDRSYDRGFNGCADLDSNIADFIVSWQASPGTGICP